MSATDNLDPHSGAVCPGLIEANLACGRLRRNRAAHSGAVCPGLIEAYLTVDLVSGVVAHSGAVCPGLIEARLSFWTTGRLQSRIPGQSAPASLKPKHVAVSVLSANQAFRGSLPRPH